MNQKAALEGLLFIAGDEGLTKDQITETLEINNDETKDLLENLKQSYLDEDKGITIEIYGEKVKMVTKPEYSKYYKKLYTDKNNSTLTPAALETLAIIAYNEPITRSMIDEIRGVNSSYLIKKLVFQNLIKEIGRSELPGRPVLYGVTDEFLDYFGLKSTKELPKINLEKTEEETDLFSLKYKEII